MTIQEQAHQIALKYAELYFNLVIPEKDNQIDKFSCWNFKDFINLYLIVYENTLSQLSKSDSPTIFPEHYPNKD